MHEGEGGSIGYYGEHGFTRKAGWALLLPPGEYVARFVYVSAPGYQSVYDPYEMPEGIWEGRQETAPVSFKVVPPTPAQLRQDEARIRNQKSPWFRSALSLFALSPAELIARFKTDGSVREDALTIIRDYYPARWREVFTALDQLPSRERDTIVSSEALSRLLREHADCGVLGFLTDQLPAIRSDLWRTFWPVFDKAAATCPSVRNRLREMVTDERLEPYARSNAAALLGTFRIDEDVPLVTAALDPTAPPGTAGWARDLLPKGAAVGLALHGSTAARAALTDALLDDRLAGRIGAELVNRLGGIGGEEVTRTLIAALRSRQPPIVRAAIGALRQRRAPAAANEIASLLSYPNASVRSSAAHAIRAIGAPGFAAQMRLAARDPNENLQSVALHYLADYGDRSDLDLFLSRIETRQQYVGQAAGMGVGRFGTEASVERLMSLLDVRHGGVHSNVQAALRQLTFVNLTSDDSPRAWEMWFAKRPGTTRVDWAREAIGEIGRAGSLAHMSRRSVAAVSYLADAGPAEYRADFERAATTRSAVLRIQAARALARIDRPLAAKLLIREFEGRLPGACWGAHDALNELAGRPRVEVRCTDPAERRRLRDTWVRETAHWKQL
jgi:HEAT repeat protein